MTTNDLLKSQATRLSQHLAEVFGVKLSRSASLEALARSYGVRDWNELSALGENASPLVKLLEQSTPGSPTPVPAPVPRRHLPSASDVRFDGVPHDVFAVIAHADRLGVHELRVRNDGTVEGTFTDQRLPLCYLTEEQVTGWLKQLEPPTGTGQWLKTWKRNLSHLSPSLATCSCALTLSQGGLHLWIRIQRVKQPGRLQELGVTEHFRVEDALRNLQGVFLVTGSTGSGKTTTLNSMAGFLEGFGRTVHRLAEDDWAQFYEMEPDLAAAHIHNYFTSIDVFIVEEIRHPRFAKLVFALAAHGKSVLATLHSPNVDACFRRLADLEVPEHLVHQHLRCVVAQMLVMATCRHCGGSGCEVCQNSGHRRRTLVSEVATFASPDAVVTRHGRPNTHNALATDALEKLANGDISGTEMVRCFGVPKRWS